MIPNSGANLTHADRPDQPNLYFWQKISRWANLANFHPIWFKFCTEVINKPLNRFRMFVVAATFFQLYNHHTYDVSQRLDTYISYK